jgi:hypothetical protein
MDVLKKEGVLSSHRRSFTLRAIYFKKSMERTDKYEIFVGQLKSGLRIRINFIRIRIRIQHFRMNTDPDPDPIRIRIRGFNDQK